MRVMQSKFTKTGWRTQITTNHLNFSPANMKSKAGLRVRGVPDYLTLCPLRRKTQDNQHPDISYNV